MRDRKPTLVIDRAVAGGRRAEDATHDNAPRVHTAIAPVSVGNRQILEPPSHVTTRVKWQRRYVTSLRITDTIVVCGAVAVAQYVRYGHDPVEYGYPSFYMATYSVLFVIIWLVALAGFHSRSPRVIGTGLEEYKRILAASIWSFVVIAMASLLVHFDIARSYLAVAFPAGVLGLLLSRWQFRRYVARKRIAGGYQSAVVAIGERKAVVNLAEELIRNPAAGYRLVGVGITGYGPPRGEYIEVGRQQIPIMGGETRVLEAIRRSGADTVAITCPELFGVQGIRKLTWELESRDVELVLCPGVADIAPSRLIMRPVGGLPLLHVEKPLYRGTARFRRRVFDFAFALVALTAALPILLVAGVLIKVNSRGSVFYASQRIGIDGKPFSMLKLRTMVIDADQQLETLLQRNESDGLLFKIRDDPRVTTVGRFLRRFSIDELPQFINVLRQEMSVVGPRPPLRREVDAYDSDIQRRLLVRPGVTGLWQVSGRSDLSWDESVRLDLWYVDNWSMTGDLLIIAKTFRAVFRRTGAY